VTGVWQWVLYLHLLAMALFIGGQLTLALVIVPIERRDPDRSRMRAMGRRFGVASVVALGILLATGIAMASHLSLWDSGTLQLKLALVVAVVLLTLAHLRWSRLHALQAAIFLASLAIVWLGLDLAT
jgi:putative copper export protein